MSFSIERNNLNEFLRIHKRGYNNSCGYYTQNCWIDDDRLVISQFRKTKNGLKESIDFIVVDVAKKTEKHLITVDVPSNRDSNSVVYGKTMYYVRGNNVLCSINVDTLECNEIYKGDTPIVFPHITADGRFINWYNKENDKDFQTCMRIDLETGEVIKMLEKGFLPPFKIANHFMLSPTNPDLLFFSHEGDTTYITNRLWLAPLGEEPYNIAKQRLDDNGNLLDCFGHESWSADGKGLYFVKYACSPEPPCGIGYVDLESREPRILYSKYKYWHVCAAPNGKYLAADLGPNDLDENDISFSSVCLIDMEKNTEEIIVDVHNNRSHPGHPHPQFNPSCTRICFHDVIDNGTLTVGVIDIK